MVFRTVIRWVHYLAIGAMFPVTGAFTGWLVGVSGSPVAASVVPVILGLAGAALYGVLESKDHVKRALEALEPAEPDRRGEAATLLRGGASPSLGAAAYWSFGVVLFCAAAFVGVRLGSAERIPDYPALTVLAPRAFEDDSDLDPVEMALLHEIRWRMVSRNISAPEAAHFFSTVIEPLIEQGRVIDAGLFHEPRRREDKLRSILDPGGGRDFAGQPLTVVYREPLDADGFS